MRYSYNKSWSIFSFSRLVTKCLKWFCMCSVSFLYDFLPFHHLSGSIPTLHHSVVYFSFIPWLHVCCLFLSLCLEFVVQYSQYFSILAIHFWSFSSTTFSALFTSLTSRNSSPSPNFLSQSTKERKSPREHLCYRTYTTLRNVHYPCKVGTLIVQRMCITVRSRALHVQRTYITRTHFVHYPNKGLHYPYTFRILIVQRTYTTHTRTYTTCTQYISLVLRVSVSLLLSSVQNRTESKEERDGGVGAKERMGRGVLSYIQLRSVGRSLG